MDATKPPTIMVGVVGIESAKQGISEPKPSIDWLLVSNLPAFQMFASVTIGNTHADLIAAVRSFVQDHHNNGTTAQLYADYCAWHEHVGYWPKETPLGDLK